MESLVGKEIEEPKVFEGLLELLGWMGIKVSQAFRGSREEMANPENHLELATVGHLGIQVYQAMLVKRVFLAHREELGQKD